MLPRPPETPPSSDLDGIDEDEVSNIDAANAAGQDGADLARARGEAAGRPEPDEKPGRDDRSR
jgi:hypothetical protein